MCVWLMVECHVCGSWCSVVCVYTGRKMRHVLEPGKYPWITPYKVSVNDNDDVTHTAKYALVKIHGQYPPLSRLEWVAGWHDSVREA